MTADLTATFSPPTLNCSPAQRTKWQREYDAFQRLLPDLLPTMREKYVAIHDEQPFDSDTDEMTLIERVLRKLGNVDIHVGLVTDQPQPVSYTHLTLPTILLV